MTITPTELSTALEFALDAAWQAGRITLGYYQTGVAAEAKADSSPVTVADRSSEQKLRELVQRFYPDDGIIGEEYGEMAGKSGRSWIIDPIDGTKSFIRGIPFYSVLIALVEDTYPVVGVMHFPALQETVYAARGQGCYCNGRRARVSTVADLAHSTLLVTEYVVKADPQKATGQQRLMESTAVQRGWGDAYGYAMAATGRAEVVLDPVMKVWDNAPLQVVMVEAGGTFTDWHGAPTIWNGSAIATNGAVFDAVMQTVRG